MSYQISKVEKLPFLGEEMNDFMTRYFSTVTASEQFLSDHPLSKELKNLVKIKPCFVFKNICANFFESILDFNIKSSDVFVCSLPKCGSSWMQTIVWLLTHNLNYEAIHTMERSVQMGDFDEVMNGDEAKVQAVEFLANDKSLSERIALKIGWNNVFARLDTPRVIKSHYPVYFLPKAIWSNGAKVIYVVRNPYDMVVSTYYQIRNIFFANVTMDDVVNATINDSICSSPGLDHILEFWRVRHLPNVFFIAYEDVVNDAFATIKEISNFLQCSYTDEQLKQLTEYISFDNMKKIKTINREDGAIKMENLLGKKRLDSDFTFLRKGKAGSFHVDLSDDQIKKLDDWIAARTMGTDFQFKIQ